MTKSTTKARSAAVSPPHPSSLTDQTSPLTWEFDIQAESLDGVSLASLVFSSAAGQVQIDNFTPDALRAIADALYDHAHDMDGRESFGREGLKNLLARVYPSIGGYPFNVPDGLITEVEFAAGIDLPPEFSEDFDPPTDEQREAISEEDAA